MLEWKEVNPLPERCIKCEEQAERYFAADDAEKRKRTLIVIVAAAIMP